MANGNIQQVSTSTLSNQNIVTALLVHTFTNTTRIRKLFVNIFLDQVAGNGDYIAHVTIQRAGAGSAYTSIKTTLALATGVTSGVFTSIPITLNATDVLKVYVIGLAGDTTTPDIIVDVNEEYFDVDTSGRVISQPSDPSLLRILDRIDFQRGHHTVVGSTFYVDGTGGNDANAGTRALPKKTISGALALCTTNAHDEIILLANSGGGPTTITESATITITKNYVQIRGVGRDVNVTRSNNGGIFDIQASGVELSGFRVTTFGGASSDAVTISNAADFARLHRLWIEAAHRDAIAINVANRSEILNCVIRAAGRDGIRISSGAGSGDYNFITDSMIRDCVGSGINFQGSDASNCRVQRNVLRTNGAGVTVAAGVLDTIITDNRFANNTVRISDAGTRTVDQWNTFDTDTSGRVLLQPSQPGVTIPTVTTLTNGSASIAAIVADYARRTGDYSILTQPDIRTAIGMAAANLDAQLALLVPGSSIELNSEITEIHTS